MFSKSGALADIVGGIIGVFSRIPEWFIALLGRFSIAAVFWKSGLTKVQNFSIDIVDGTFQLGLPQFADSTVDLFKEEYKLPLLSPELAAFLGTTAELTLPILILFGFATRFAAFGLLMMTLTIQLLVYPGAYPVHGTWATILLFLMAKGPGAISIDHVIARLAK